MGHYCLVSMEVEGILETFVGRAGWWWLMSSVLPALVSVLTPGVGVGI